MKHLFKTLMFLIPIISSGQKLPEILKMSEPNTYEYKEYFDNGNIMKVVGFWSAKPFENIESFQTKLKDYKIKYHGKRQEFYSNGQLKEIVEYDKGKVISFMKSYFDDGEEYSAVTDKIPTFQFKIEEHQNWINERISQIEKRIGNDLSGTGLIVLEIYKSGEIKEIKVRASDPSNEPYLSEIGSQIKVIQPAIKNGQNIGTRFSFKVSF